MAFKIFLRFVIPIIFMFFIATFGDFSPDFWRIILHKTILVLWGYVVAEAIWQIGYKKFYGKLENVISRPNKGLALAVLKSSLYATIIISFAFGI